MKNAVSWLKFRVARLNPSLEESEGKLLLDSVIIQSKPQYRPTLQTKGVA